MKKNTVIAVLLAGIIPLMFACNTEKKEPAAAVVDKEQIKKEIQAKEDDFASIYNTGELRNIGYYADDATVFYQHRAPIVGKEFIVKFLTDGLDSNTNRITFTTKEVFPSNNGNQVVEIGEFKVVDSANNALNSGNYMVLFEKRDGKYVSVREMSASDMPLQ
jgi:ketosteroid isomerase-like protein